MSNDHITSEAVASEIDSLINEAGPEPSEIAATEQAEAIQQQIAANEDEWKEIIQQLTGPAFMVLAPNWNLQDSEIEMLASAYASVLNKYFPDGAGGMGPELGAVMVTLAIFGPRLKMPRKLPESTGGGTGERSGEVPENAD